MFGPIDLARPQITHQQLIAAEHIQRQKTVMVITAMKESSLLTTVYCIIGCIEIENQLLGGGGKGGNEAFNQNFVDSNRFVPAHAVFEPTQGRCAGQRLVFIKCRLQQ